MAAAKSFKVAVFGDAGVGKTSLIDRHKTGNFRFVPTHKGNVTCLYFNTNHGEYRLDIFGAGDVVDEKFNDADACIVMFDVTKKSSYENAFKHCITAKETDAKCVVICGNKYDLIEQPGSINPEDIQINKIFGYPFYFISAKSSYNFEKPFYEILKKLTGNQDLVFIESRF